MVKQIYDQDMYDEIEQERECEAFYIQLRDEDIQQWINNGYFAHLKRELQPYHDMYFACQKVNGGCLYSFFFANEMARNRFQAMVNKLFQNEKVRLVECKVEDYIEGTLETDVLSMSVCPLFS